MLDILDIDISKLSKVLWARTRMGAPIRASEPLYRQGIRESLVADARPAKVCIKRTQPPQLVLLEAIECGFEVVQDDCIRQALEDKREFPKGVDAVWGARAVDDVSDGQDIHDQKADAERHCDEQDAEARRDAAQLEDAKLVAPRNVPEERAARVDPPGVAEEGLEGARVPEEVVEVVEVEEVCHDFEDPVGLREDDGRDVDCADAPAEEGLVLYPGDDVVHCPRCVEEDCADGEVPAVVWGVGEDECSLEHAEYELREGLV